MSVSEIFARLGEADFRRREREACRELAGERDCVIATGGGAPTFRKMWKPWQVPALSCCWMWRRRCCCCGWGGQNPAAAGRADREEKFLVSVPGGCPLYRRAARYRFPSGGGIPRSGSGAGADGIKGKPAGEESAKTPMEPRQNSSQKTVGQTGMTLYHETEQKCRRILYEPDRRAKSIYRFLASATYGWGYFLLWRCADCEETVTAETEVGFRRIHRRAAKARLGIPLFCVQDGKERMTT